MRLNRRRHGFVVSWCLIGLAVPRWTPAAEPIRMPVASDVSLAADATLGGKLSTSSGQPRAGATIQLRRGLDLVHSTVTGDDGSFVFPHVRPGVYEVVSAQASAVCRVWSARTAPPSARPALAIVESGPIVRGQPPWSANRRILILSGIILTSGVIGGVIGYNIKDDDPAS